MLPDDNPQDPEALDRASVCFAGASRLLYCEPQPETVAEQALSGQFAEAPFGMEDESVRRGLALLDGWCARAARCGGGDAPLERDGGRPSDDAAFPERPEAGPSAGDLARNPVFADQVASLRREWLRLFVGVGVPEASCFESFYVDPNSAMFGRNVLEVRRSYRRFGLQVEHLHSEPDDHLGLMLGFLGHLMSLESAARRSGDEDAARDLRAEQDAFLSGHVLPWLSVWRYNVGKFAASDYFRGVGELVFGLCRSYAGRFGIHYDEGASAFKRARP